MPKLPSQLPVCNPCQLLVRCAKHRMCRATAAQLQGLTLCGPPAGPECTCTTCKMQVPKSEQQHVATSAHTYSDPENRRHKD